MNKVSDSELIMLIQENNEDAAEILRHRYHIIIKKIIGLYYADLKNLNINIDELIESCHEVVNRAIEEYNSMGEASFNTYVNILIKRKIKKQIIQTIREKKKNFENLFCNVDDISDTCGSNFLDPLEEMCSKESNTFLNNIIIEKLNNKELAVISLLLDGLSCKQIARALAQSYSQTYRYIQNIKRKLAPELEKFAN